MSTKHHVVTLITIAMFTVACDSEPPREPAPLERVSPKEPMLTSTITSSEKLAPPKAIEPIADEENDTTSTTETEAIHATPDETETLYPPTLQGEDGITIHRLLTAPDVEAREPIAASAVFAHHEEKVYAFLDVSNDSPEAKTVTVFFVGPSGKVSGGAELTIPPSVPRWRTWAYTRFADEVGLWRVEVRTAEGVLLGALPFEVAEGC